VFEVDFAEVKKEKKVENTLVQHGGETRVHDLIKQRSLFAFMQ
jgi:hypothetical protein